MAFTRSRQGDSAGNPRKEVVGGSVSETEKGEVLAALESMDFPSQSVGVRQVMLTVSRNPKVREVLLSHLDRAA